MRLLTYSSDRWNYFTSTARPVMQASTRIFSTFCGGIKEGESPISAVIRELHEELGALIKPW